MKTVNIKDLNRIKMNTNPPVEIVESGYRVIHNGKVKCHVGIGWVVEKEQATAEDFETIPVVVE